MAITLNNFGDCTTNVTGTGRGTCDISTFGDAKGIGLTTKGWSLSTSSGDLAESDYKALLKSLTLIPFLGSYNFEDNTPDTEQFTSSTGEITDIRDAKPMLSFMFDHGSCFHKALYNKKGKGRWDYFIIFETGVLFATDDDGSIIRGFEGGQLTVPSWKLQQGTDPQSSTAMLQLLDTYQFNANHTFLTWDSLGFNMNRVEPPIEAALSYNVTPAAGTSLQVKATGSCNSGEFIDGFTAATNWRLGGTQAASINISSVAFNATNGVYTFTLSAALASGDTVQVEFYDSTANVAAVEDSAGNIYKGKAPLATIA